MPTTRRPDDDDDRPAHGLRDDDFDDRLRARRPLSPKEQEGIRRRYRVAAKAERSTDEAREAREEAEEERKKDERQPYQLRKHENYAKDPADWLAIPRMTQTEVSLRLAQFLISSQLISGPVTLTLAGYELTRRDKPQFPIDRYLVEDLRFTAKHPIGEVCSGRYIMKDCPYALVIGWDRLDGHLITTLASGQRLVVFVSAGKIVASRNPSDHKQLRNVIGRAMTWQSADALDFLAVCVPRSVHYLELCKAYRDAEGVIRARIALLNVDRHTGQVYGLPSLTDLIKS